METAERYRVPALIGGMGLSLFWVLTSGFRDALADPSAGRAGLSILGYAAVWLSIIGFLGFGKRYLNRTSGSQKYLAEASYPMYIVHQTVIVVIAFYLVGTGLPEVVQWVLLLVGAVALTFAVYEIVRRVNPLRFLFGMRTRPRVPSTVERPAAAIESGRS
jgi:glucans biosynthesis protein C